MAAPASISTAGVACMADAASLARLKRRATLSVRCALIDTTALSTLCGFAAMVATSMTGPRAGRDPTGPSPHPARISATASGAARPMLLRWTTRGGICLVRRRGVAAVPLRDHEIRVGLERIDRLIPEAPYVRPECRDRGPVGVAAIVVVIAALREQP